MAGKVVDVTLRLIDKMTSPLNALGGKLADSANQWVRSGKQIENAGKSIANVGMGMTKAVTVPIASAGVACAKLASDFEAGMSKVRSIAGETSDSELTGLEKTAKDMGLSFKEGADSSATAMNILAEKAKQMGAKTKFSANEATEAYSYMAMAGWKAGDMLEGIEGIMYLAGATGEDLATTSDIVTDALTAFGMGAQDTERFVDVLAKTSSNANTNVSMLGESFQYVAPVAGALGYNVEDVSTALGLMANSGIKASTAGTSLRSWMSRMSAPTKQTQQAMDALGLSLTDSEGNMKDFKTLMEETRKSFAGLSEAEKAQYASMLAGKTGMSGLLAIVNAADSDFNSLSESIYNSSGACKEMYEVANDNLQGQLTVLKSTVESIAISFGERLTPYVKKLVTFLQSCADKFNNLSDKGKDLVVKISLIAAAIGPVLLVFGKTVGVVGKVVSTVGRLGKAIKTAGSLVGLITSPAGIVIGVLAAIAAGVFLVIKNWDKIKPFLQKVKQWFVDSFGGAGGAFENLKLALRVVIATVTPYINQLLRWFKDMIPKAGEFLSKTIQKLKPILQNVLKGAINGLCNGILLLAKAFQKAVPVIVNFVKSAIEKIAPVVKTVITVIRQAIPIIQDALARAFQVLAPIIQNVVSVIWSIIQVVGQQLVKVFDAAKPTLSKFGEMIGVIFQFAADKISGFWEFIKPIVQGIINTILGIAKILSPAFNAAVSVVGGILKGFLSVAGTIISGIIKVIGGLCDFISGVFTGNWRKAWEGVKQIFSAIFSTFAGLAKAPINAVIAIVNKAITSLNKLKITIPAWVPGGMGGKSFGINIPTIPSLAKGTDNWKGGIVQISEKGGEIVDLPAGSRVYPHDESVNKAYRDGAKSQRAAGTVNINVPKLADQIIVREDADIDKIVESLANKLEKISLNLGGGEIGYSY